MTARRTFAADTSVPVDRTRAEIRTLLEEWGCSGMGWHEHFTDGAVELGFVWDPSVVGLVGRKAAYCDHGRWSCSEPHPVADGAKWNEGLPVASGQLFRVRMKLKIGADPQKQRQAHRLLLLKLKADLNAAQAGLAKAEEVFLPWIVDGHGNTVSDVILPKIRAGYLALPAKTGADV